MNSALAVNWGKWLAAYFSSQGKNNPFLLATKFGWRVVLENAEAPGAFIPARYAEWDGRERRISLFLCMLRRLTNSANVLHRACAHEVFHGLAAVDYRMLQLPPESIPRLNHCEEEIAAQVFSETLINSYREEETCPLSASR